MREICRPSLRPTVRDSIAHQPEHTTTRKASIALQSPLQLTQLANIALLISNTIIQNPSTAHHLPLTQPSSIALHLSPTTTRKHSAAPLPTPTIL